MKGSLSHELEAALPADELWGIYGSLKLSQLCMERLPHFFPKVDVEEGDGKAGTILRVTFGPGINFYREIFVKVDDEARVKESKVIEGAYLALGFSFYMMRVSVVEKTSNSSIIKLDIEYELEEANAAKASLVSIGPLVAIAEATAKCLQEKKAHIA